MGHFNVVVLQDHVCACMSLILYSHLSSLRSVKSLEDAVKILEEQYEVVEQVKSDVEVLKGGKSDETTAKRCQAKIVL